MTQGMKTPPPSKRAGQRALRRGRFSEPGRFYHVTTVTRDRVPLFADLFLGRAVVRCLMQMDRSGACRTLAYVVMPDHLHWLFALETDVSLSRLVQRFKTNSARLVNAQRGAGGETVWQPGFYDHALRRDEDVLQVARYIVANPLRAGLVASLRGYPLWDAVWV